MLVKEVYDALVMELKYSPFLDLQSQGQAREARQQECSERASKELQLGLWR